MVAAEWLASLRAGMRDPARRAAVLAVTAQADTDPDSAQALAQLLADRLAALNDLLKPSGTQVTAEEYNLLSGPVLTRVLFDRAEVTDEFIASAVEHWLAAAPEAPA